MKTKRMALEKMNKRNNPNLVMDINLSEGIGESINFANIIAEAMAEYKSWNTCNFVNRIEMFSQNEKLFSIFRFQ